MLLEVSDDTPIKSILKDLRDFYSARKNTLEFELKEFSKGSVCKRKIKGNYYYYLVYRDESGKFHSDYLGKKEPKELKDQIEIRRKKEKQLQKANKALYALGVGYRIGNISSNTRFAVLERDNFTCQYCGISANESKLHVDHIIPVTKGGTNDLKNLVTSCEQCNNSKGKRIVEEPYLNQVIDVLESINDHCKRYVATDEWIEQLTEEINNANDILGDSEKFIF